MRLIRRCNRPNRHVHRIRPGPEQQTRRDVMRPSVLDPDDPGPRPGRRNRAAIADARPNGTSLLSLAGARHRAKSDDQKPRFGIDSSDFLVGVRERGLLAASRH